MAPIIPILTSLFGPAVARDAALRMGVPEEALPPIVNTGLNALGGLYGLHLMNTGTPEEIAQMLPRYSIGSSDPSFDASMQDLYAERDRAMDYGYAYPQEGMAQQTPPGYIQPTEEELRGLGAPGGASGGLAALVRRGYA